MPARQKIKRPSFGIVVSYFNRFLTDRLLKACLDEFSRQGIAPHDIQVLKVPGAFEIPVAALHLAKARNIRAVICLGAIVRGETFHYELVARETARGAQQVALMTGKPVIFEVLAADTIDLCEARAMEGDHDNKGAEAARVALEMTRVLKDL
jgi:6,7-dimethyl-8-ribityllumazine synthase